MSTAGYDATCWAESKSTKEIQTEIDRLESLWRLRHPNPFPKSANDSYLRMIALENIVARRNDDLDIVLEMLKGAGFDAFISVQAPIVCIRINNGTVFVWPMADACVDLDIADPEFIDKLKAFAKQCSQHDDCPSCPRRT